MKAIMKAGPSFAELREKESIHTLEKEIRMPDDPQKLSFYEAAARLVDEYREYTCFIVSWQDKHGEAQLRFKTDQANDSEGVRMIGARFSDGMFIPAGRLL